MLHYKKCDTTSQHIYLRIKCLFQHTISSQISLMKSEFSLYKCFISFTLTDIMMKYHNNQYNIQQVLKIWLGCLGWYNLVFSEHIFQGCKEHTTNFRCQSLKRHTRHYHAVLKYKNNRAETMTATIIELYLNFQKLCIVILFCSG